MTEVEIAWIAGIIEGEGSITIKNYGSERPEDYPILRVAMTDEDIIRRIHRITNVGNVNYTADRGPNRKPCWTWAVRARDDVKEMLQAIFPWMGIRRSGKIEEALIRLDRPFKIGTKNCPDAVNPCGTYAAAGRHKRRGEDVCDPCLEARREYQRNWERQYRANLIEKKNTNETRI